jgi:type III pantothenate kinase
MLVRHAGPRQKGMTASAFKTGHHSMQGEALLTIDVGNSRVKYGMFLAPHGPWPQGLPPCEEAVAVSHQEALQAPPVDRLAGAGNVSMAVLAGVNPGIIAALVAQWPRERWPAPRLLESAADLPLVCRVDAPNSVGIDRLLNAVAANRLREPGRGMLVIDAGTATTVDLIAADGAFEGGAILPGMELSARALHEHTALLPRVDIQAFPSELPRLPGKNTRDAIAAGLFWGQLGALRELASTMAASVEVDLLVTGGAGRLLAASLEEKARFEPDLPLKGLAIAGWRQG